MTDTPLTGLRILVVEDDYYLASDVSTMIEKAGGEVVGPFGTTEDAIKAFDGEGADLAVIDINLGNGPSFELAHHLQSAGLPFLITTGYDEAVVPKDLSAVVLLEKPFSQGGLIHAAASVYEAAGAGRS